MPIDWSSSVKAHEQIAAAITGQIHDGTLGEDQRLPDRDALGLEFDVSHATVSKALSVLRAEGLVVYKPGRGVFVAVDLKR